MASVPNGTRIFLKYNKKNNYIIDSRKGGRNESFSFSARGPFGPPVRGVMIRSVSFSSPPPLTPSSATSSTSHQFWPAIDTLSQNHHGRLFDLFRRRHATTRPKAHRRRQARQGHDEAIGLGNDENHGASGLQRSPCLTQCDLGRVGQGKRRGRQRDRGLHRFHLLVAVRPSRTPVPHPTSWCRCRFRRRIRCPSGWRR